MITLPSSSHPACSRSYPSLASEFPNDNFALHSGVIWVQIEPCGAPVSERAPVAERVLEVASESVVEIVMSEPSDEPDDAGHAERESEVPAPRYSEVVARAFVDAEIDGDDDAIVVEPMEAFEAFESTIVDAPVAMIEDAPSATQEIARERDEIAPPAFTDEFDAFVAALSDAALGAGDHVAAAAIRPLLVEGAPPATLGADAVGALVAGGIVDEVSSRVTHRFATVRDAWRALLRGASDDMSACGSAMLDEWAADIVARAMGSPASASAIQRELRTRGVAAFGMVVAA